MGGKAAAWYHDPRLFNAGFLRSASSSGCLSAYLPCEDFAYQLRVTKTSTAQKDLLDQYDDTASMDDMVAYWGAGVYLQRLR
jgi:hypothetical protein